MIRRFVIRGKESEVRILQFWTSIFIYETLHLRLLVARWAEYGRNEMKKRVSHVKRNGTDGHYLELQFITELC